MKLSQRILPSLAFTAALALLTSALSSCANDTPADAGQAVRTIQIWQSFNTEEAAVFRKAMEQFEKQWLADRGETLKVDIQYVAYNDMFTKLRTAALANITPDVAFVDSIKVTDLALGQALVPLDELDSFQSRYEDIESARPEFVQAPFNACVVNRLGSVNLYGLPVQTTTIALFWNRRIFRDHAEDLAAAGLDPNRAPLDWDEMIAYGEVLTDTGKGVYAYGASGSLWFNFPFFNMYGVEFIRYNEDGRAVPDLNTARGRAALSRIQSIVQSGIEGGAWKRSALAPDAGFLNGKYAMALTGPWNVENFANSGLDFDIALIPAPTQKEIEELGLEPSDPSLVSQLGQLAFTSSNLGGQTGVIMRSSEQPELAFEVLEYFTSEPVQREWASSLGQIPVRLAAWQDLDTARHPTMDRFMLQLRTARRIPQIPLFGILESDVFNPQMDLLLQGKQSPEEMLRKMEIGLEQKILRKLNEGRPAS